MPITSTNPFKGRHFPGEVIVLCVRWYLRYPLAYEHVAELLAERGVEVDPSCIWRWVQAYAPELNKRCRPHLQSTNKSYRTDETYIKVKGENKYLYRAVDSTGQTIEFLLALPPSGMPPLPNASSVSPELPRQSCAPGYQRGPEPGSSARRGSAESRRYPPSSGSPASVQIPQ